MLTERQVVRLVCRLKLGRCATLFSLLPLISTSLGCATQSATSAAVLQQVAAVNTTVQGARQQKWCWGDVAENSNFCDAALVSPGMLTQHAYSWRRGGQQLLQIFSQRDLLNKQKC